jgi:hexosaminidase
MTRVVDNDGKHTMANEQLGAAPLLKGYHKFTRKICGPGGNNTVKSIYNRTG